MPLLPASLTEPLWVQFSTLLNEDDRPESVADHPWGCHRRRIPDRVVFDHVLAAVVHGSGYERVATPGCSDLTIRRRLAEWTERDVGVELLKAALAAYDQMIGFDLDDLSWMGRSQNRPAEGNFRVGPRSIAVSKAPNARWSPTGAASPSPSSGPAPTGTTHRCTNPMRQIPDMIGPLPDQPCVHLDRGYDSTPTRDLLDEFGYVHEIARKPIPAPIQAGKRWVVERTHSWMNGTARARSAAAPRNAAATVEFSLHLAATLTVLRRLINEARTRYRWPAQPTTRRLK